MTILLVEVAGRDIYWTEPKDVVVQRGEAEKASVAISSNHTRRRSTYWYDYDETPLAFAAMVDGSVRRVPVGIRTDSPLLQIGGCTDEALDQLWHSQFNWRHAIGLPVWLVFVVLLFYRAIRVGIARRSAARGAGMKSC